MGNARRSWGTTNKGKRRVRACRVHNTSTSDNCRAATIDLLPNIIPKSKGSKVATGVLPYKPRITNTASHNESIVKILAHGRVFYATQLAHLCYNICQKHDHVAELETVTLKLPAQLVSELNAAGQSVMADLLQRGLHDLHIEQALEQYRRGDKSFGAAAVQAGLTQSEMTAHAYVRGPEPPDREETLAEELQ